MRGRRLIKKTLIRLGGGYFWFMFARVKFTEETLPLIVEEFSSSLPHIIILV